VSNTLGRKGLAQRARILGVAREVLVAGGLDRLKLREIAALAGISIGNLQYYFKTREDLLEALFRADFEAIGTALEVVALSSEPATVSFLATLCTQLVAQWTTDDRNVCIALTVLAAHEERFAKLYEELYQRVYEDLSEVLRPFAPTDSKAALMEKARLIASVLDGASAQARIPGRPAKRAADRRLLDGVHALVVAIATDSIQTVRTKKRSAAEQRGATRRARRS
jgi:AcrR family transcriptional regulator